jgi:hypothetical protein
MTVDSKKDKLFWRPPGVLDKKKRFQKNKSWISI